MIVFQYALAIMVLVSPVVGVAGLWVACWAHQHGRPLWLCAGLAASALGTLSLGGWVLIRAFLRRGT